ncbi:MAG: AhpC/TSA family protein [Bacteroidaceae bacterium]|nr:AhpC/TSA family protein [Bacteroidaceae bacterium]
MNKKTIITILLALVALAGQGQVHYRIEGNIDMPKFTGVMEIKDVLKQQSIDTIKVVNGIITPKEGDLPEMAMCLLADTTKTTVQRDSVSRKESKLTLGMLFVENGTIKVEGLDGHGLKQSGTPISIEIAAFNQRLAEIKEKYEEESAERKTALTEVLYEVITRHSSDVYGIYVLVNEGRWYLDTSQWLELYDKLIQDNGEYIDRTPFLADDLKRTSEKYKRLISMPPTDVGCKFVDFAVEYEGKTTRLSDYVGRGKYVLVDFWGSWCGACKYEIPNIITAYNKYKDKGLKVVGIAAWDKPEDTLKAIDEMQIPYPQILNTQKRATDLYGIKGIPETILFSPDGTIFARGLRGEDIDKKLKEIFNDNK